MPHVIVVDDDPAICDVLQIAIESLEGYRTDRAGDPNEARLALGLERPDAAIIDATLPRGSGLALAGELISLGIPVLIITGDPRQIDRVTGSGCPFLIKPFPISALIDKISELIDDAAARMVGLNVDLAGISTQPVPISGYRPDGPAHLSSVMQVPGAGGLRQANDPGVSAFTWFDEIIHLAVMATDAEMGTLQVTDRLGGLRIVGSIGFDEAFLDFFAVVDGDDGSACGMAYQRASRIIVGDVEQSPIFIGKQSGEVLRRAGVRSVQSTPIKLQGRLIAMISTHRRAVWQPSAAHLTKLDAVVGRAAAEITEMMGS